MNRTLKTRRHVLATGATAVGALLTARTGLLLPAQAAGLAPTPTMRGGANNYHPGAPVMERIGGGGFMMTGTVRRAGDGAPLPGMRIQIWAHTTEGNERDQRSHGATLTAADGTFQMDMPQIVPTFGQPHGHLAYDAEQDEAFGGGTFETVFLRPVMSSASETTLHADFVLQPA
ncbi:twin-arginine translocation pathway signal [Tepidamorphus sp. 3E244]|uniref:twin-arginine translocation pathway signal n=1 Tax=Tepidamorphus sp. 3E244 TaxID=3385498 RepID=UPI0038FD1D51